MKQQHAIVDSTTWLTPTILGIRLKRPDGKSFFSWQPGQYASINFPDYQHLAGYRPFSIASSPIQAQVMDFGIRVHGPYTNTLRALQAGDRATVQGPFGKFTARGAGNRPIVLLAGGIGVTPFMSMIRTAADLELATPITLLFSNRTAAEIPYRDELLALAKKNSHFRVLFAVSNEPVPPKTPRSVAGQLSGDTIFSTVGESFWGSTFFLCGPTPFMNAMERTLIAMGIESNHIRSESFGIKPGALFEQGSPWPKLIFASWGSAAAIALGLIATHHKKSTPITSPITIPTTTTDSGTTPVQPVNTDVPTVATNAPESITITPPTTSTNTNRVVNTNSAATNTAPVRTTPTTPTTVQPTPYTPPPVYSRPRATMS